MKGRLATIAQGPRIQGLCKIHLGDIGESQLDIETCRHLFEDRFEAFVNLIGHDMSTGGRQGSCKGPRACTNLDDAVARPDVRNRDDLPGAIGIRKEVLTEAMDGRQPVSLEKTGNLCSVLRGHGLKIRVALAVVTAATSSTGVPQTSARAFPTNATQAGSFCSPR